MTRDDIRISDVQLATLGGKQVKIFTAHVRSVEYGEAFVHAGVFTAPARKATSRLWQIIASKQVEELGL